MEKFVSGFCHQLTSFYQLKIWNLWLDPSYYWLAHNNGILEDIRVDTIYQYEILEIKVYIVLTLISFDILDNMFYKTIFILQLVYKI